MAAAYEDRAGAEATAAAPNGGPTLLLAPEDYPDVSHLITEDGAAVDSIYSERQYRLLTDALDSSWAGPGDGLPFVAMANVGLFFANRNPAIVPDFLLSLGVRLPRDLRKKEHQSYLVWEFGKPPDVLVEIVSDRLGGEDSYKLHLYASQGIRYYAIYDPFEKLRGGVLRSFSLTATGYAPIPDHRLEGVGLGLVLWQGVYAGAEAQWLRWCDHTGQLIPTGAERAEQEKQRAEQEKQRAEQAEARARELAERLQQLEARLQARDDQPPT